MANGFKVVKSPDGSCRINSKIDEDTFVVGVQWHPEMLSSTYKDFQNIFMNFVKIAEKRKICSFLVWLLFFI